VGFNNNTGKAKGKRRAIPIQVWTGPEGSRKLRIPDLEQSPHEGGTGRFC